MRDMNDSIKIHSHNWAPGDLVKIKRSEWSGRNYESVGVVVGIDNPADASQWEKQIKIFSEILIFDSRRRRIIKYQSYDLELISANA